jgi:hypothetical protein
VTHAVAAHLGLRDFDAALLADDAAVLQALVLAAQALVVLDRPEDLGAEELMVSGFFTSPNDQLRIFSGDARPILMASKCSSGVNCLKRSSRPFMGSPRS